MEKMKKFLDYMQNANAMPNMIWEQIYPKGKVSKRSQRIFIDWLNKNDIAISTQTQFGGILMLINKTTLKFLSIEDIMKIAPEWYKPEKTEERSILTTIDFTTHICTKFDKNIKSGWLDTFGKFTELDWGDHSLYAREYIEINEMKERKRNFHKKTGLINSKDFLIGELNFVLFDCPENNGYVKITYHEGHLTKKQEQFITDYLISLGDTDTLNKIIGE